MFTAEVDVFKEFDLMFLLKQGDLCTKQPDHIFRISHILIVTTLRSRSTKTN